MDFKSIIGHCKKYDKYMGVQVVPGFLGKTKVVGTYRLLSNKHLKSNEAFICENEFDVSKLKNCNYDILELGRAVVDKEYRNGVVIKLLWQGLFNYCKMHNIRFMFGTGSFHGVNYEENKQAFAYLHKYHKISDEFDCVAKAPSVTLDMLNFDEIDERAAKTQIPALLKGYISLGSKVGTGVYLDYEFNSSDVMIILDMQNINAAFAKRMFGVEL